MMLRLSAEVGLSMLRSRSRLALGAVLLFAVALSTAGTVVVLALPRALDQTSTAYEQRLPFAEPDAPLIGYALEVSTLLGQRDFTVLFVDSVEGATAPPGVVALPGPGDAVVSPAVRRRLESGDSIVSARINSARVIGEVDPDGLRFPDELLAYVGVRRADNSLPLDPITQWGVPPGVHFEQRNVPSHVWILLSLALGIPALVVVRAVFRQMWVSSQGLSDALSAAGGSYRLLSACVRWQIVPFAGVGILLGLPTARLLWPVVQRLPWRFPPEFPDVGVSVLFAATVVVVGSLWSVWRLGFVEPSNRHVRRSWVPIVAGLAALGSAVALAVIDGREPRVAVGFFGAAIVLIASSAPILRWLDGAIAHVLPSRSPAWLEYGLSPVAKEGSGGPLLYNLVLVAMWLAMFGSGVAGVFATATTVSSGVSAPVAPDVAFVSVSRNNMSELATQVDHLYPISRWAADGVAALGCGGYQLLAGDQELDCSSEMVVFGPNDAVVRQVAHELQLAFPALDIRRASAGSGSPTLPFEMSGSSESVWVASDLPLTAAFGDPDLDPVSFAVVQSARPIDELRNIGLPLGGYPFSDNVGPIGNVARADGINRVETRMVSITQHTAVVVSVYVQVFLTLAFALASWAYLSEAAYLRGLELAGARRWTIFRASLVTVGLPLSLRVLTGVAIGAYTGAMYARFTGYASHMNWPVASLVVGTLGFLGVSIAAALARSRSNSLTTSRTS